MYVLCKLICTGSIVILMQLWLQVFSCW